MPDMAIAKATLSKIHIAKQQLGMDDDIYRGLLARVAGVRSSKELSTRQASAVLNEFERLGWKPKPSSKVKGKPHNFKELPERIRKIEAQLADMMQKNADGSLTLYLQKDSPGADKESNWLPAPDGPIYLGLRLYVPEPAARDGSWTVPPILRRD